MYCCDEKCFIVPRIQMDGMACKVCRSFSYCRCKCFTYMTKMERVLYAIKIAEQRKQELSEEFKLFEREITKDFSEKEFRIFESYKP